ncbi:MAG: type II toxin-antitoxin system VapB family antitoxin [Caulobacter sp.]
MGIFIKNPETERKARELARLRGESLTAVIDAALDKALEAEPPVVRKAKTIEEMIAATEQFRRKVGLDKVELNVTKADFDALWEEDELDIGAKPLDRG